jgi:DNA-binding NarL/FixJ family response regulator
VRLVLAEDSALLRAGLVELLVKEGFEVVAEVGDGTEVVEVVRESRPDVVLLDIRMPPTHTTEGLTAARQLREEHGAELGILLLSHHVETRHAVDLLADGVNGLGYLLKDRILDPAELVEAIRRVADGGSAIDPVVVERLLRRQRADAAVADLTPREREVLSAMAEGRSNASIAARLHISAKTVESCIGRIFTKLELEDDRDHHRRVRAVLAHLQATPAE